MDSTHTRKTLRSSISRESPQIHCTLLTTILTIQLQEQKTSHSGIKSWRNLTCSILGSSHSSYYKKDVNGKVTEKDSKHLQTHGTS